MVDFWPYSTSTIRKEWTYENDNVGNRLGVTETEGIVSQPITYGYDPAKQLAREIRSGLLAYDVRLPTIFRMFTEDWGAGTEEYKNNPFIKP